MVAIASCIKHLLIVYNYLCSLSYLQHRIPIIIILCCAACVCVGNAITVELSPSGDVMVCPYSRDVIHLTCNITTTFQILEWKTSSPSDVSGITVTFTSSNPVGTMKGPEKYPGIIATLDSISGTGVSSTITANTSYVTLPIIIECRFELTSSGVSLNQAGSVCVYVHVCMEFIYLTICCDTAGTPGVPGNLEIISNSSQENTSTLVQLGWSPPDINGGVDIDNYTLIITPSPPTITPSPPTITPFTVDTSTISPCTTPSPPSLSVTPYTIITTNTTATVSLPSNMTYNMSVRASNCAGTSDASELNHIHLSESVVMR